jgi:hypothetical protein
MKHKDWRSRFWSKVDMSNRGGCWNWTASISKNGYGSFKLFGKAMTTSRVAYWIGHGQQPGDMMVLHKCDNRACCNPDHLYLGDVKQNSRDMMERGRHRTGPVRGEQNGNAKLTEEDVRKIRRMIQDGERNQEIAARFGVTHQMIPKIRRGHFWQHVTIEKGEAA